MCSYSACHMYHGNGIRRAVSQPPSTGGLFFGEDVPSELAFGKEKQRGLKWMEGSKRRTRMRRTFGEDCFGRMNN